MVDERPIFALSDAARPLLTTLDAQRPSYAAQRAAVAVELAQANAAISLCRALGADSLLNDLPAH